MSIQTSNQVTLFVAAEVFISSPTTYGVYYYVLEIVDGIYNKLNALYDKAEL